MPRRSPGHGDGDGGDRLALRPGERLDPAGRTLQPGSRRIGQRFQPAPQGSLVEVQRVIGFPLVELHRVTAEGLFASTLHVVDDGPNGLEDFFGEGLNLAGGHVLGGATGKRHGVLSGWAVIGRRETRRWRRSSSPIAAPMLASWRDAATRAKYSRSASS